MRDPQLHRRGRRRQADRRAAVMLTVNALQGATREAAGSKVRSTAAHPAAEL